MPGLPDGPPPDLQYGDPACFITRDTVLEVRGITHLLSLTNELDSAELHSVAFNPDDLKEKDHKLWQPKLSSFTTLCLRDHQVISCVRSASFEVTLITPNPRYTDHPERNAENADSLQQPPRLYAAFCEPPQTALKVIKMLGKQFGKETPRHGVARFFLHHASKSNFTFNDHSHAIKDFLAFTWKQDTSENRQMAFTMLRDYVHLACASKIARRFEVKGIAKQKNLQYWLSMKPDHPVFVAQVQEAPGLCEQYLSVERPSAKQVKVINKIIRTYLKFRPNDKDSITSNTHEHVKDHPIYDSTGRNQLQYLLAIVYRNAFRHVKSLNDVIGKIMKWRKNNQDTSIEAMKAEEESYLDLLMDALDQAIVWSELWVDFLDAFKQFWSGHLVWLQELFSLTSGTIRLTDINHLEYLGDSDLASSMDAEYFEKQKEILRASCKSKNLSKNGGIADLRERLERYSRNVLLRATNVVKTASVQDPVFLRKQLADRNVATKDTHSLTGLQLKLLGALLDQKLADIGAETEARRITRAIRDLGLEQINQKQANIDALQKYWRMVYKIATQQLLAEPNDGDASENDDDENALETMNIWHDRALAYIDVSTQYTRCLRKLQPGQNNTLEEKHQFANHKAYYTSMCLQVLEVKPSARDQQMTSVRDIIEECVDRLNDASDAELCREVIADYLGRENRAINLDRVDGFTGTWHCEFIQTTLAKLANRRRKDYISKTPSSVCLPSRETIDRFQSLDNLMCITKKCCAACNLFVPEQKMRNLRGEFKQLIPPGYHLEWHPFSLPAWMLYEDAEEYRSRVLAVLMVRIQKLVDDAKRRRDSISDVASMSQQSQEAGGISGKTDVTTGASKLEEIKEESEDSDLGDLPRRFARARIFSEDTTDTESSVKQFRS